MLLRTFEPIKLILFFIVLVVIFFIKKSLSNFFIKSEIELTDCDIIGCGGITSGLDAFEHILCGASAVQIGTQFHIEGDTVFKRISNELETIMKDKNYLKLSDFRGKLKEF